MIYKLKSLRETILNRSVRSFIKSEVSVTIKSLKDAIINSVIWSAMIAVTSGYILQSFGMSKNYGEFQAASLITSAVGFETYRTIFRLLSDIEGEKIILYYFSLPIKSNVVFFRLCVIFALNGVIMSTVTLLVLKAVLWNQINIANINFALFYLVVIVIASLFATFSIFLTAYTPSMQKIGNTLMRVLFPIWFMGGYQFSFAAAKSISNVVACMSLVSPYMYANEAMRGIILSSGEFIPIWKCLTVLVIMTVIFWKIGISKIKRRLDII
ncbi:ABC transporter permease [Candidatus Nesciobacter abundans]|uniref:ABC-2 type transporter domain-containing protein n=2 Tax=Candidatus Nesciobacter abundans TaxID=2601668 RepID=A0A5C0UG65_9PROT|nr:hypothetical protein [Candidatus Nesciobacter abundans]QEK39096.1 hypothetical protein FZC36_01435 [Candidatus Nesciobacter abundans]